MVERPTLTRTTLPKTVIVLGMVSLLNDTASEMVTPLLPIFLTVTLGAGPAVVGIIEGMAEAVSSVLKLWSGWLADRGFRHKRLLLSGYGLSNVARPAIALAFGWAWVLSMRVADRVGKGLRTAPRDALIAGAVTPATLGRAFGFHRAMDHAGATLGPLLAAALLALSLELHTIFLWSVVPGVLLLALIAIALPKAAVPTVASHRAWPRWRVLDRRLRRLIACAGGVALAATPEAFLVLWAFDKGMTLVALPLLWALASFVKMGAAWLAGHCSDRAGPLRVLPVVWGLRVLTLLALATAGSQPFLVVALFLIYAGVLALAEAPERALLGQLAPVEARATLFGVYHLTIGLAALPGAVLFGIAWQWLGAASAFILAALITLLATMSFLGQAYWHDRDDIAH